MGTTYTRQSSFSDGDTITAALFNNEYNQLLTAFSYASSGTTGHQHDGTAAEGGNVHTIGDQDFLNKIVADSTNNRWGVFVEVSSSAVEQIRIQDGAIVPVTDNDIDLGTSSLEFKDAYFDGTVTTDGLTVSSTTNLDGAIQVDNTITVGVDDTGYDVKFFGATASAYMLWDASTDDLVLAGAAGIDLAGDIDVDGTANLDVVDIDGAVDMASTLTLAGNADFNGDLDVDGTTNLDVVDIDGAVDMASTLTLAGNADFNGDLDVDGTANLDAVDIDGAVQIDGTVTVGVDDTGKDVKFFGATSGSYLLWDESADSLLLTDSTPVKIGDAQDMTLYHDGTNSYLTNAVGALKVATETSGIAVTIGHTTSETTVADNLTVTGNASIGGDLDVTGSFDMSDANITNIGSIALDTITNDGTDITLDSSGDIVLDAGGADIFFKDDGTTFGSATNTSGNLIIKSGTTTALTFSGANVTSAGTYTGGGTMTTGGNIVIPDAGNIGSASDTNAIGISSGGVVSVTATTANTSATDGALTVAGGLGVAADASIGDDLRLISDAAILSFGADSDVTLTHVADTGVLLNSTMAIQFNDASQYINAPSNAILDINATDEIELNATLVDVNANLDVSGTYTGGGLMTTGGNIVIPNAGNIGSASDTDAIAIASNGVVTFSQVPVLPDDTVATADIQDNAVTLAKMAGLARGKIIYGDSSGDPAALAVGSANYVLTSDGTDISWASAVNSDPASADGDSLGTASLEWSDLYLADGGVIYLGNDQDVLLTHVADSGLTMSVTGNNVAQFSVSQDKDNASTGPVFNLYRYSASPADGDGGGLIQFYMENDNDQLFTAAQIFASAVDVSDGTEDGKLVINTMKAGTATAALTLSELGTGTFGGNIIIPNAGNIGSAGDTDAIAISSAGVVALSATTEASAIGTAALTVAGGIGVTKDMWIGDDIVLDSDAAVIKLGADQDVTITHVADTGISLNSMDIAGVASINGNQIGGRRNYIYNGDMAICQRSTSVSVTVNGNAGLHVQDRWGIDEAGSPSVVFTMSQSTTTPDGFYSSLKMDCTTASGTVGADDLVMLEQVLEGRDLQGWNKGDAQAKSVTLSFWVNATKTGTYIVNFYDNDNSGRIISKSYTVSSSNTWEYKTITFEGDTTGAFDNDSAGSLYIYWGLVAGTNHTSGTLATSWASNVAANRFVGQVDAFDNTANNFHITGVQLELGDTASAFEYQRFGDNLAQCQRYFCRTYGYGTATGTATNNGAIASTSQAVSTYASAGTWQFPVDMRAAPTVTLYSTQNSNTTGKVTSDTTDGTGQATMISSTSVFINRADDNSGVNNNNYIKAHAIATADL